MESLMKENKLYDASFKGDIQSLNELLREDRLILNHYGRASGLCFNETPLHIAATQGPVNFAKALLQHKPDLINELDSRLRAPLHLASANGQVEMVKLLLDADSDVCLIEDEFGRTPLHLAAMVKGRVEVVNELVRARPEAVMYPLNRMKTVSILHLYVIRNGPKALEQLVEVDHTFLNSQDGEGNTILHKVVALKQLETLEYLISRRTRLVVNLKNGNNLTAMDTIEQMPRDSDTAKIRKLLIKAGDLNAETLVSPLEPNSTQLLHGEVDQINATKMQPVRVIDAKTPSQDVVVKDNKESWMDRKRDAILVTATLIAGMAYQAGSNPPGGVWDENDQMYTNLHGHNVTLRTGKSIMAVNYPRIYIIFWSFNTASFVAALTIVLLLIRGSPHLGTTWCRILRQKLYMWFLTGVIWVMATSMAVTYLFAMLVITPGIQWGSASIIVGCSVIGWLGFVGIVFLVNACPFLVCVIKKVAKSAKRSCRNENEGERQGHGNAGSTICCMSV
ncbi:hypothetical protein LguiB_016458 [Lonicera macranthoides]